MKKAYIFPGQGAQFKGMGLELYQSNSNAKALFESANKILEFDISSIMFEGSEEELKSTNVTQPAVFIHSVALAIALGEKFDPIAVAGHSLGEFSALVSAKALSFEDGLRLVYKRAVAMKKACSKVPSTMAVVLGMEDRKVEEICNSTEGIVVAANYNSPGQLVISGSLEAVNAACITLKEAGAKRAMLLNVGGAFHSPLMNPAKEELKIAIDNAEFRTPICPIYQNYKALPFTNPSEIKENLIDQLTAPVLWTSTVENMVKDGITEFVELGPGSVLKGLISKIAPEALCESFQTL